MIGHGLHVSHMAELADLSEPCTVAEGTKRVATAGEEGILKWVVADATTEPTRRGFYEVSQFDFGEAVTVPPSCLNTNEVVREVGPMQVPYKFDLHASGALRTVLKSLREAKEITEICK